VSREKEGSLVYLPHLRRWRRRIARRVLDRSDLRVVIHPSRNVQVPEDEIAFVLVDLLNLVEMMRWLVVYELALLRFGRIVNQLSSQEAALVSLVDREGPWRERIAGHPTLPGL